VTVVELELEAALAWERRQHEPAFERVEVRRSRLKRRCDCGHWIDGSEPYRYAVWKVRGAAGVEQRLDCEFCARVDARY
jgi:hypothetical protein